MSKKFKHLNLSPHWQQYFSKYPDGYTIIENLIDWVSQVNKMVTSYNELVEHVDNFKDAVNNTTDGFRDELDLFLGQFDDNLTQTVVEILQEWQDTGFLDVVIDSALETKYHEMDDRLTAQMAQTDNVINTANWDLSLTEDNADKINARIAELDGDKFWVILLDNLYPIKSRIDIQNKKIALVSNAGGFKAMDDFPQDSMLTVKYCPSILISGLELDGNEKARNGIDITDSPNHVIEYNHIHDIGNSGYSNVTAIHNSIGNDFSVVKHNKIKDIVSNSVTTGINYGNFRDETKPTKYFHVDNNYLENVLPSADGDGIKIQAIGHKVYGKISNNVLVNCAKRAVKIQANKVTTKENNILEGCSYAGIDFHGEGNRSINDKMTFTETTPNNFFGLAKDSTVINPQVRSERTDTTMQSFMLQSFDEVGDLGNITISGGSVEGFSYPIRQASSAKQIDELVIKDIIFKRFDRSYGTNNGFDIEIGYLEFVNVTIITEHNLTSFFYNELNVDRYNVQGNVSNSTIFGNGFLGRKGIIKNNLNSSFEENGELRTRYYHRNPQEVTNTLFLNSVQGDIVYHSNPTIRDEGGYNPHVIEKWICVGDSSEEFPNGQWYEFAIRPLN